MHTAAEIARALDGQVIGNPETSLTGFAPASTAKPGDLTFAENETYFQQAEKTPAAAILVDRAFPGATKTLIKVGNSRIAFAKVLPLFFPPKVFPAGIHPSAVIGAGAVVDPTAHIGPFCVLSERVHVGARAVLHGGNHLAADVRVGDDSQLFSNVVVYARSQIGQRVIVHAGTVIGSDGFGYVLDEGFHRKVPQVGQVIVQDDVEIGANVTIDRGALGATVIGRGTKIDNLVQIGHNVTIGEHCILVSQVGIAGSTRVGNYVTMGGQVGVAGHLKIGNFVTIAAKSGVMNDIPDGEKWFGAPARPDRQTKRMMIAMQQLPDFIRRFRDLERHIRRQGPRPAGSLPETPPGDVVE